MKNLKKKIALMVLTVLTISSIATNVNANAGNNRGKEEIVTTHYRPSKYFVKRQFYNNVPPKKEYFADSGFIGELPLVSFEVVGSRYLATYAGHLYAPEY